MNDFSDRLFSYMRQQVQLSHPSCFCTTAAVESTETKLPALFAEFSFPEVDARTVDSSGEELWTPTVIDAEVYSSTSLQEAKAIAKAADEAMRECGFRRTSMGPRENADPTVRRIAISWRGQLDASGTVARY